MPRVPENAGKRKPNRSLRGARPSFDKKLLFHGPFLVLTVIIIFLPSEMSRPNLC